MKITTIHSSCHSKFILIMYTLPKTYSGNLDFICSEAASANAQVLLLLVLSLENTSERLRVPYGELKKNISGLMSHKANALTTVKSLCPLIEEFDQMIQFYYYV